MIYSIFKANNKNSLNASLPLFHASRKNTNITFTFPNKAFLTTKDKTHIPKKRPDIYVLKTIWQNH